MRLGWACYDFGMVSSAVRVGWVVLVVALRAGAARADELDPLTQQSVEKTQALLTNPEARGAAVQSDPKARDADATARKVTISDANTEAMYQLASELFGSLARESGGDPQRMSEILRGATADPESFAAKLTPSQRAELEQLAKSVEAAQHR